MIIFIVLVRVCGTCCGLCKGGVTKLDALRLAVDLNGKGCHTIFQVLAIGFQLFSIHIKVHYNVISLQRPLTARFAPVIGTACLRAIRQGVLLIFARILLAVVELGWGDGHVNILPAASHLFKPDIRCRRCHKRNGTRSLAGRDVRAALSGKEEAIHIDRTVYIQLHIGQVIGSACIGSGGRIAGGRHILVRKYVSFPVPLIAVIEIEGFSAGNRQFCAFRNRHPDACQKLHVFRNRGGAAEDIDVKLAIDREDIITGVNLYINVQRYAGDLQIPLDVYLTAVTIREIAFCDLSIRQFEQCFVSGRSNQQYSRLCAHTGRPDRRISPQLGTCLKRQGSLNILHIVLGNGNTLPLTMPEVLEPPRNSRISKSS